MTQPWDSHEDNFLPFTTVVFQQGNKHRILQVQAGLPVRPVLSTLFSAFPVEHIQWLPFESPELGIPVDDKDIFCRALSIMLAGTVIYHPSHWMDSDSSAKPANSQTSHGY